MRKLLHLLRFYVVLNQNAKTDLVFYDGGIDNHLTDDPDRYTGCADKFWIRKLSNIPKLKKINFGFLSEFEFSRLKFNFDFLSEFEFFRLKFKFDFLSLNFNA